ncbi:MAG: phosphatase PAP2 family protein [Clostridia bacterium]|nr:phosphatase PAP2 family protein [Clostridia bacterium]
MTSGSVQKMKRIFKKIPKYGYVFAVVYFLLEMFCYSFGNFLANVIGTAENPIIPKIPCIDDKIPYIGCFITIYFFSYIFWLMGTLATSMTKKRNFVNYLFGLSIAYLIGFLIFVFFPTGMDRVAEGLIDISNGTGLNALSLRVMYALDGGNNAFNLFPSFHCMISTYCYLGVRKQPEISRGYRIFSLVMTVLICASTLFVKQHYFVDVVGGVGLAVITHIIAGLINPGKRFER